MYYYTEEILKQLAEKALGTYENADSYEILRSQVDTETADKILYARWWPLEPYHTDYISEMDDGTVEIRKLYKKKPSRMKNISVHYYKDERLLYSVGYGENGEISYETLYQYQDNCKIGLSFMAKGTSPHFLTLETFDAQGKPCEFMHLQIRKSTVYGDNAMLLRHRLYRYEGGCITAAEAIDNFAITKPVRLYDDGAYESIGNILTPDTPQMNPPDVMHYAFLYPEHGFPEAFVRTYFSYGKTGSPQFRMKQSLMKLYADYGIEVFTKK